MVGFPDSDSSPVSTVRSVCVSQATKIHQRALGSDHPLTARSLELMATVYAEIGKTEYSGEVEEKNTARSTWDRAGSSRFSVSSSFCSGQT